MKLADGYSSATNEVHGHGVFVAEKDLQEIVMTTPPAKLLVVMYDFLHKKIGKPVFKVNKSYEPPLKTVNWGGKEMYFDAVGKPKPKQPPPKMTLPPEEWSVLKELYKDMKENLYFASTPLLDQIGKKTGVHNLASGTLAEWGEEPFIKVQVDEYFLNVVIDD